MIIGESERGEVEWKEFEEGRRYKIGKTNILGKEG